jgi:hypothetical protein
MQKWLPGLIQSSGKGFSSVFYEVRATVSIPPPFSLPTPDRSGGRKGRSNINRNACSVKALFIDLFPRKEGGG